MIFEAIVQPGLLVFESDQDTRRPPVFRDDDLLVSSQTKVFREVILHLRERHGPKSACRSLRATRSLAPCR